MLPQTEGRLTRLGEKDVSLTMDKENEKFEDQRTSQPSNYVEVSSNKEKVLAWGDCDCQLMAHQPKRRERLSMGLISIRREENI